MTKYGAISNEQQPSQEELQRAQQTSLDLPVLRNAETAHDAVALSSSHLQKRAVAAVSALVFLVASTLVYFGDDAIVGPIDGARPAFLPILSSSHHDKSKHHHRDHHRQSKNHLRKHDPNDALWYKQVVDHFAPPGGKKKSKSKYWDQRYYIDHRHWKGPGHPIFLVIGGEGTLEGMLYPFINDHLAKKFGAFVIQPEHRFYGKSQPVGSTLNNLPTNEELATLLTPQQAMEDMLAIAQHYRYKVLGCSADKLSKHYCPVISVGGSYPGFLSAMMRLVHPEIVDIGYASSAPLLLYSQDTDQYGYYEVVTKSADISVAGCADAVKSTLMTVASAIMQHGGDSDSFKDVAARMGICTDSIPEYITSAQLFAQESMMIIEDTFADANMDFYPPSVETDVGQMCKIFMDETLSPTDKVAAFYSRLMQGDDYQEDVEKIRIEQHEKKKKRAEEPICFDMRTPLPPGPNSTVSCSDWSGCGPGLDSFMWEFQECSLLIVQTGFSDKSMFPPRPFTLEWLTQHCRSKFDISPQPYSLVEEWGYDDLVGKGASYILFTNGLNDMWSAGSHLEDLSNTIIALNFPNGAHHSDLSHQGPTDMDTDDLKQGFVDITRILSEWLKDVHK